MDSLNHFNHIYYLVGEKSATENQINPLYEVERSVLKTRVEVRDMNMYIKQLQGVRECQQNLNG